MDIERKIVERLLDDALAQNLTVSVYDGEVYALVRSYDKSAIFDAMFTTETDTLVLWSGNHRLGSVTLIYGNGRDVIADHSDNEFINKLVFPASLLAERL